MSPSSEVSSGQVKVENKAEAISIILLMLCK